MQGLGAENHIDKGCALGNGFALLAGHAAAYTYHQVWIGLFEMLPAAKLVKYLFLGFFADGAGVEKNNIGIGSIVGGYHIVAVAE